MKLQGFIGPAYSLSSSNVDAQRCVNMYPVKIESGTGKGGQQYYLKATPGLLELCTAGDGPIRLIHVDSIGRIFVVSGNKLYVLTESAGTWTATLCDTSGTAGTGDPFVFDTSEGPVKAASMSFVGDGTDSSTLFVDGVNNYLYYDSSPDVLGYLDDGEILTCTFAFSTYADVTFTISDSSDIVTFENKIIAFDTYTGSSGTGVSIWLASVNSGGTTFIQLSVSVASNAATFTTAQLVEWINNGSVSGRSDVTRFTAGNVVYQNYYNLSASGGDSTSVRTVSPTPGLDFETLVTGGVAGFGYGIVPNATHVQWSDGYFLVNEGGTNKFFVSDLKSFNIDTLEFASAEGSPDLLVGLIVNHRNLILFGELTTEIFVNTGNGDFPFERVQGGFLEIGCVAKYSISKASGTVFFLGKSDIGQSMVYSMQGLSVQRISNHAIEYAISTYENISTATAYNYEDNGVIFYVLNFDEATWVYDVSTGSWHERAYTNAGTLERHRVEVHAFDAATKTHLGGDYETNKIYAISNDVYADDGDEITRLRSSPHLSADLKRLFCSSFQLDMEVGIGLDGGVQGSSPTVMFDFSDDGGHTWSSESWALADNAAGSIGEYKTRVRWTRLGSFRDRIFRVKMTDPVKTIWIDAQLDVIAGES